MDILQTAPEETSSATAARPPQCLFNAINIKNSCEYPNKLKFTKADVQSYTSVADSMGLAAVNSAPISTNNLSYRFKGTQIDRNYATFYY